MVVNKEAIMERLKGRIGEDTSDEALSLLEDVTDTLDELEKRASEDWKGKYEENDAYWRKRYQERFFTGQEPSEDTTVLDQDENEEPEKAPGEDLTLEDLLQ